MCLQIIRDPYQVTCCGNSFCRVCIERIKTDNKHCPTCNEENITIFPDKRLQRSLYDFEVYCTHKDKGCNWTGELRQLENHLNENPQLDRELEGCLFTRVDCKFKSVGCEVKTARGDVPDHLKDHSENHLKLLQSSKSPLSAAFLEAQEQIGKLSQHVLGVNRTVSELKEKHERELSQLNRTTELKQKQVVEIEAQHRQQLSTMEQQLAKTMNQHRQQLSVTTEQYEQQLTSLNATLRRITEEYERLQEQVRTQPFPPSSSQASVGQTPALGIGTPTPPFTFTMTDFDVCKKDEIEWFSPPFYTHHHGYKMCLAVYSNGWRNSKWHGTDVSVFIYLKRGEFDDDLKWPFRGDVEVSLIDQDEKRHYSLTIQFIDDTPDVNAGRVTEGSIDGGCMGLVNFISHNDLQPNYLKNNCLMFQITSVIIKFN